MDIISENVSSGYMHMLILAPPHLPVSKCVRRIKKIFYGSILTNKRKKI
ncbi:MAG: transposase [Alphaproteobacteria bacterium]|nr:transposase [Alphaproteobacteria bacterium]